MNYPLVSIIIPVFNGANYLSQAIDSALSQTYKNIEIIVINDGSNDDNATEKLALSYGEKIRYFSKKNGGVSSALNLGIEKMKGEYFSWLSHDDMYSNDKIESQITLIERYQKDTIAICSTKFIDKNSNEITMLFHNQYANKFITWSDMLERLVYKGGISGCALLIPKKIFDQCGLFDEGLRFTQDTDLWIRFCLNKISWITSSDIGVFSRIHDGQVTQSQRTLFHNESYSKSDERIQQLLPISTKHKNFLYWYAVHQAKMGQDRKSVV